MKQNTLHSLPDKALLLIIVTELLWSQPVLQVVVTRSEIRAAGRVVKQLPVEML
jgi:hypothetical protein